jgi:hypothetical protein
MPIATYSPTRPAAPVATPIPIQPPSYHSAVVEDPVTPVRGLLAYVAGSSGSRLLYSQIFRPITTSKT